MVRKMTTMNLLLLSVAFGAAYSHAQQRACDVCPVEQVGEPVRHYAAEGQQLECDVCPIAAGQHRAQIRLTRLSVSAND